MTNWMIPAVLALGVASGFGYWVFQSPPSTPRPPDSYVLAREWDKLPITAILKSADPQLNTYFQKQQAYVAKLNQLMGAQSPEYVQSLLWDIRRDPFFPSECMCALRVLNEVMMFNPIPRATLVKMYPNHAKEIAATYTESISFQEALSVFKRKVGTA